MYIFLKIDFVFANTLQKNLLTITTQSKHWPTYVRFVEVPVFYHSCRTKAKPEISLKMAVFKEIGGFSLPVILLERKGKKKVKRNDLCCSKSIGSEACLCSPGKNYSCRARQGSKLLQKSYPLENSLQKAVFEGRGC